MSRGLALLDTSVLLELLRVPGKSGSMPDVERGFVEQCARADLVLPIATVIETGNHIGQCAGDRHRVASRFCTLIGDALDGRTPFVMHPFPDAATWRSLLREFPAWATRGVGLGDLSIVQTCEDLRRRFPDRRVTIWTLDHDLDAWSDPDA